MLNTSATVFYNIPRYSTRNQTILVMGSTVHKRDSSVSFLSKVIMLKVLNWSRDSRSKADSNIDSESPRYSTCKGLFALWATAAVWFYTMGSWAV